MNKKRILVVEDEVELVKALQIRLEASGYEVLAAYDGMEGLEKAKKENPDLIILDIMMPKMDGYATLSKLKEAGETKDIPVIMLTAKAQSDDVARSMQLGAADYIAKPFSHMSLLEKIGKTLS